MRRCVWLLEDSLGPDDPALRACPEAPAVFVFDDDWYRDHATSFKRLFFVYESAIETISEREPAGEVRRGVVVTEVFDFCRKHGAEEIHVTRSVSPAYRQHVESLRRTFLVVEHAPERLAVWRGRPPRRFMDLWKEALPRVLPEDAGEEPAEP